ncbi:MAG: DUF5979 domain-containing protein [Lachnospiraceae bacterium]|nr:DUF5979 domain-containing protein [Lachnospiraceae bacterium]
MRKMKWLKNCVPLVLAFSLVLGSAAAVGAENAPILQDRTVEETELVSNSEELSTEETEDASIAAEDTVAETEKPSAEETPYEELLEDDNLIIVTVDEGGSRPAEQISVEAVEDLSEPELQALEEYIEEQGYSVSRAAMMAAVPDTEVRTITFSMDGFLSLSLEGYGSGYDAVFIVHPYNYQGNCNAYCIDPSVQAPGHNAQKQQISYTTTVRDYRDPLLLKILYYGFGGPEDLTASFASTGPSRHILTHMAATRRAAELGIPGAGNYTYRANATAIEKANALYETIKAKEGIIGTASVLTPVPGQQTLLLLANYEKPVKQTLIRLKKSSANPAISDGHSLYSLKGALYGVYSDAELKNQVASFETREDGSSTETLSLNVGSYYIKEIRAPIGYKLDETVYKAEGKAGETVTVNVIDEPYADPVELLLQKVDEKTGKASERLKGAQFTVKYYASESADPAGKPDRTWVFETDSNGEIYLNDDYKVDGDALFFNMERTPVLPLGTITICETKAPAGYLLNDTVYTCKVEAKDGKVKTESLPTGENAVRETPIATELTVRKTVSGSGGNRNTEFHFVLKLTAADGIALPSEVNGLKPDLSEENAASWNFTLHHGQEICFKDLPVGLEYSVEETDGEDAGYTVKAEHATGKLKEEPVLVTFENSREMVIPTAADTNSHAMTGVMLAAAFLLMAGGILTLERKRRHG